MKKNLIFISLACLLGLSLLFAPAAFADEPTNPKLDCSEANLHNLTEAEQHTCHCKSSGLSPVENVKCGVHATNPNVANQDNSKTFDDTVASVIHVLSVIIGIISVIVIIIQGLRFVTSGGDQKTVQGARNGIIYAIVGLVIVAMAQTIVWVLLDKLE